MVGASIIYATCTPKPISGMELEGESDDMVEIYDSCDEVRRKVSAHLKKTGQT